MNHRRRHSRFLTWASLAVMAALPLAVPPGGLAAAEPRVFSLTSVDGLELKGVQVSAVEYQGRRAVRLIEAPGAQGDTMAAIKGLEFADGTIELDLAGQPAPGAPEGARGFVGVAFRVQSDGRLECFYLRPTNGRADDQLRRNRSTQYVSHPEFPWFRLRKENPGLYESYVDLEPGAWTKVKIVVAGAKARLYVHGAEQPALIVNDLKLGGAARGGVGLWIDAGTEAHFASLTVRP
jgi:hypothetical protein